MTSCNETATEAHKAWARMDEKLMEEKRSFTSVMAVLEEWDELEKTINKLEAKLEEVEKESVKFDANVGEEEKVRMEELLARKAVLVKAKESVEGKLSVLHIAIHWLE